MINEVHFEDERNWLNHVYTGIQEHTFMDIDVIAVHPASIILLDSMCGERHVVIKDKFHTVYLDYNGSRIILAPCTEISVINKSLSIKGSTKVTVIAEKDSVMLRIDPYTFEEIEIEIYPLIKNEGNKE